MVYSKRFICVLDANILVPIVYRDILLWFAHYDLFTPKWSKNILSEWERVMKKMQVPEVEIIKRLSWPNQAFPDALVTNYEELIESLTLPDPKDRHVLAAAIKTNANVIVTNNLKDFPEDYLNNFGLSAKNVDDFLTDIIDLNSKKAISAFREMVLHLNNPPMDELDVLDSMRNRGLKATADYLHSQI